MGEIKTTIEKASGLTLVKGTGALTFADFTKWLEGYFPERVTSLILWDEIEADLSGLDAGPLRRLARQAQTRSDARQAGKVAVVGARPLAFGLGRLFQTFTEMEGLSYVVQRFRNVEDARAWLALKTPYASDTTIDHERRIVRKTVTGELTTDRSLRLVREAALMVDDNRGYDVLMDLRATLSRPEMLDLMRIATECKKLKATFDSKVAFLIPDTKERRRFAALFRTCMEAQGFSFRQFFTPDAAMAWLTEKA